MRRYLLLAAVAFIGIGKGKFEAHSDWIEIFERLGFGQWLRYFTGVLQVGGGLLVLIPRTSAVGIIMLAITMVGAMGAWVLFLGVPLAAIIPGAILGGLLVVGADDLMELVSSLQKRFATPTANKR